MVETFVIQGKFTYIRYRHELTGFTVASFKLNDHQEKTITVTGILPKIDTHHLYECKGHYIEHERYGLQFEIEQLSLQKPSDEESLIQYFASSSFSGIGRKTAEKIVNRLGLNAIAKIQEDPTLLNEIFKENDKRIQSILTGIEKKNELDESVLFFNKIGLNVRSLEKIQVAYGDEAMYIIQENPYRLVEDIDGIGFKTSDKIASILGFESDHPYRIKALIESEVLEECIRSGNSYVEKAEFEYSLMKRLQKENLNPDDCDLENMMNDLLMNRFIVIENDRIYHHTQFDAEKGIADFLNHFPYVANAKTTIQDIDNEIKMIESEFGIQYEQKQIDAIKMFFEKPFSILTGGPGTGKTTIVKAILALYQKFFYSDQVMLSAPTGRASKRLSECSNMPACTLHRLLKWDLETNSFMVNEEEPLYLDCLIIDEFSMVDQWLFYNLCKASKHIKKILIIGDEDQLPSVGIGTVLKDCIESNKFSVLRLEKIFRQSSGSDIVELAYEMKQGSCEILKYGKDIKFFECPSNNIKDQILNIVNHAFEKGYKDQDIQVLSPMYSGVCGIDQLNLSLQKMMNPRNSFSKEIQVGYRIFREHDKVLQLKNLPDEDVYNGDIGEIIEIMKKEDGYPTDCICVDFDGILVEYTRERFELLTHAYCISIHKSQGSEYPIVVMPISNMHKAMLSRRLIYTGITRAKKSLVVLGNYETLKKVLANQNERQRKTTLKMRILSE